MALTMCPLVQHLKLPLQDLHNATQWVRSFYRSIHQSPIYRYYSQTTFIIIWGSCRLYISAILIFVSLTPLETMLGISRSFYENLCAWRVCLKQADTWRPPNYTKSWALSCNPRLLNSEPVSEFAWETPIKNLSSRILFGFLQRSHFYRQTKLDMEQDCKVSIRPQHSSRIKNTSLIGLLSCL